MVDCQASSGIPGVRLKVLVITDSLAFPRIEPETVRYEDTYVALLKDEFPECDFIHVGRGGATIVDLYKHSAYYHGTVTPAVVLMHVGIVDCAPRALTVTEHHIVTRLPVLGGVAVALTRRYARALRRWRRLTYTSISTFADYADRFEALFPNIHWIGILPGDSAYEARVEGIRKNIDRYNAVLRSRRFVSTDGFVRADIMSDFHHLSVQGHHKLFSLLARLLRPELEAKSRDATSDVAFDCAGRTSKDRIAR